MNQLPEVCELIEQTIGQAVQNSLNNMKRDCTRITKRIEDEKQRDAQVQLKNSERRLRKVALFVVFSFVALIVPLCIALEKLDRSFGIFDGLDALADKTASMPYDDLAADYLESMVKGTVGVAHMFGDSSQVLVACVVVLATYYLLNTKLQLFWRYEPELGAERLSELERYKGVCQAVLAKQREWYTEYQNQATLSEE